jgi:DNA-binding NarL/FixJ family response regulator
MIRILIVDDQEIVRQGLSVILKGEPEIKVVGTAANGQQALELSEQLEPDVVLMDLQMPGMNGIQATRAIVEKAPQTRVVVLTTYTNEDWVFDAIRAGACSYLLKDSDGAEIVRALRGAIVGETWIDPAVAGRVLAEFNRLAAGRPISSNPPEVPPIELTEREQGVLQHLANGKTNREIAETLFLSEGTVKNYVSTILSKLQANDRTQAAILALKRGLAKLE